MKVQCTENTKNAIKFLLKKKQLSTRRERDLNTRKRKHDDPEKKKERQLEKDIMMKKKP